MRLRTLLGLVDREGADVNRPGRLKETPMMAAASEGKSDCVEKLIKKGTNVNSTDFRGETALHWAVQARDNQCGAPHKGRS